MGMLVAKESPTAMMNARSPPRDTCPGLVCAYITLGSILRGTHQRGSKAILIQPGVQLPSRKLISRRRVCIRNASAVPWVCWYRPRGGSHIIREYDIREGSKGEQREAEGSKVPSVRCHATPRHSPRLRINEEHPEQLLPAKPALLRDVGEVHRSEG